MTNSADALERALPNTQPSSAVSQRLRGLVTKEGSLAIGMLILVLALNVPFLQLPYYWDSLWIIGGAEHILENGFKPLLPAGWDAIGHPVLLHEVLALAWLLLGRALWVSHLAIVGFAFLTVYFTYRIARLLYDRRTGLIAALLLLFYPLFRAQSTVVLLDLPTAAFAMMAVYFLLRRRTLLYLICVSAMVLTKATGVLLVPTVLLYLFVKNYRQRSWRETLAVLAVHSIPIFIVAGWIWYHGQATGWLPFLDAETKSPTGVLSAYLPPALFTRQGAIYTFLWQAWRFFGKVFLTGVLTLLIIVYSFSVRPFLPLLRRRQLSWQAVLDAFRTQPIWQVWGPKEQIILLGLPIVLHLAFMSSNFWMYRYLLPEYPLFFILSARAIRGIFKRERLIAAVTIAVLLIFTIGWTQPWFGYSLASPSTLMYVDFVATHQAAAAFIESNYPDKVVLAGWPQYIELSMPVHGYVKRPSKVIAYASPLRYAKPRMIALGARYFSEPETLTIDDFDLVYYSDRTYMPDADMLLDIVGRFQLPLIAEFRKNAEYVAIYGNPRSTIDSSSQ